MSSISHRILLAFFVLAVGCSDEDEHARLDTQLNLANNVVTTSPEPFAPTHGGIGMGKSNIGPGGSTVPKVNLVLSEVPIPRAGEGNCGQWVNDLGKDIEVDLYSVLAPGTYAIVDTGDRVGKAEIVFRNRRWQEGKLVVEEGSETHGAVVRGTIDATDRDGARLQLRFEMLFHGCGRS